MVREALEAQRPRIAHELAEESMSRRERAYACRCLCVDAVMDEAFEPSARVVEDAERSVPRVDQRARGDDDALEDRVELEVLADREDGLDQAFETSRDRIQGHIPPHQPSAPSELRERSFRGPCSTVRRQKEPS